MDAPGFKPETRCIEIICRPIPPKFAVAPPAPDKIPLAYPLVRSHSAQVSADRWQSFAGALTAGGGTRGAMLRLFDERGHDVDAVRTKKTMGRVVQP